MNNTESDVENIEIVIPSLDQRKFLPFNFERHIRELKEELLNCQELKSLKNGFNYGFFMSAYKEKAGKFLDEERPMCDYTFENEHKSLKFILKKRIFKNSIDMLTYHKHNSKTKKKKFLEYIKKNDVERVNKLLDNGLDPNYIDSSGVTPLVAAVLQKKSRDLIYMLVGGGAHLDFRNENSLTPLHMAAMKGKDEAVKLLLELGSSANYLDDNKLTPLYLGVKNEITNSSINKLCYEHADTNVVDKYKNTVLHQASKLGKFELLDDLITYSSDINRKNHVGNTALHLAAVEKQDACVKILLKRGADKRILNHSDKTAADLCTSESLKKYIELFQESDKTQNTATPKYNIKRRTSSVQVGKIFINGGLQTTYSKSLVNLSTITDDSGDENVKLESNALNSISTSTSSHEILSQRLYNGLRCDNADLKTSDNISDDDDDDSDDEASPPLIRKNLKNYRRTVVLISGHQGLGFILRGAAGSTLPASLDFKPSDELPALQYFEYVEPGSPADRAGIKKLDFLVEINDEDVRSATHTHTVSLLKGAKGKLNLTIVTVPNISDTFLTGKTRSFIVNNSKNGIIRPGNFKLHNGYSDKALKRQRSRASAVLEPLSETPEEEIDEVFENCYNIQRTKLPNAEPHKQTHNPILPSRIDNNNNETSINLIDNCLLDGMPPQQTNPTNNHSKRPPPVPPKHFNTNHGTTSKFVGKSNSTNTFDVKNVPSSKTQININNTGPNSIASWSVDEVVNMLASMGLKQYINDFKSNKVDGFKLLHLKRKDFIDLGVRDVHHRMNIERGILRANRTTSSC